MSSDLVNGKGTITEPCLGMSAKLWTSRHSFKFECVPFFGYRWQLEQRRRERVAKREKRDYGMVKYPHQYLAPTFAWLWFEVTLWLPILSDGMLGYRIGTLETAISNYESQIARLKYLQDSARRHKRDLEQILNQSKEQTA